MKTQNDIDRPCGRPLGINTYSKCSRRNVVKQILNERMVA